MSDSKARMLRDIRRALNRNGPLPAGVGQALDERLRNPSPNLQPAISADLVKLFIDKALGVGCSLDRIDSLTQVPAAVLAHLEAHGVPLSVVVASQPDLEALAWSNRIEVAYRAARGDDLASVTGAYAGVAESGTVVLRSGRASPTTLNFLPDDHLVVLRESQIVGHLEDVWAAMRQQELPMPRTLNLITGPSKTGDIEQTIYDGAHGPRRFHIILVSA